MWHCSPKSCLKRLFPSQRRVSQNIFGNELWFLACVSGRCLVFCRFLPMFFFTLRNCSSESRPINFFFVRSAFRRQARPPFASFPPSSPPLLSSSRGAGPGSLSFFLHACAQAATPSRSARPSMHSPLASSLFFSLSLSLCPGRPPSPFLLFLSFSLSLSLSHSLCLSLSLLHALLCLWESAS